MPTYYDILGVESDASEEEIKHAYREIMKQHHPDIHGQQNDPLSRLVNEAYGVLKDPRSRMRYDTSLVSSRGSTKTEPAKPSTPPTYPPARPAKTPPPPNNSKQVITHSYLGSCRKCFGCGGEPICLDCYLGMAPKAPMGWELCRSCRGWRKKSHTKDNPIWKGFADGSWSGRNECIHCNGTGLEPTRGSNFDQTA